MSLFRPGLAAALVLTTSGAAAQSTVVPAAADPPPLAFFGFEAGLSLASIAVQVQSLGGQNLECRQARADHSVHECRATVFDPVGGRPVAVWLSAMDSLTGILTLSGEVTADQLEGWKTDLESQFGLVGARVQGPQWSMQWVRRGRMIRLTWRIEHGKRAASVSMVDGRVLDAWGTRWEQAHHPVRASD
jgi:hypothetical protein